jgi:hypothetical protein
MIPDDIGASVEVTVHDSVSCSAGLFGWWQSPLFPNSSANILADAVFGRRGRSPAFGKRLFCLVVGDTLFLRAAFQVIVGGVLVFFWIGSSQRHEAGGWNSTSCRNKD